MMPILAQMGVPGGPEILIILLLMIVSLGIPILVIALIIKLIQKPADQELQQRVSLLEDEIAELREQINTEK